MSLLCFLPAMAWDHEADVADEVTGELRRPVICTFSTYEDCENDNGVPNTSCWGGFSRETFCMYSGHLVQRRRAVKTDIRHPFLHLGSGSSRFGFGQLVEARTQYHVFIPQVVVVKEFVEGWNLIHFA